MQQGQQTNMQNQPGMMPRPPAVISTKDALYLVDMLSWNLLAMKKANFFAGQCKDQEVSTLITTCGQMHQKHYNQILKHATNNQSQAQSFGMQ